MEEIKEIKKINGNTLCDETARESADTAQQTANVALTNVFGVAKIVEYDASKKQLLGDSYSASGGSKKLAIYGTNMDGVATITVGSNNYAVQNHDKYNVVATYIAEDGLHVLHGAFTSPFGTEVELTEVAFPLSTTYTAGDGIAIEDGVISADTDVLATKESVDGKLDSANPVATGSFSLGRKSGTAVGIGSFAVGSDVEATGEYSISIGYRTKATGSKSIAEGYDTIASGQSSHSEGSGTEAKGGEQHVQGRHNIPDTTSAHIVGNGNGYGDKANSNAHTLDWSGNAWFAGDVYVGSTSGTNKDDGSVKLAKVTETVSTADTATEATEFYLKSSTVDSTKRFKITVTDDGTLTATEVV